MPITPHTERHFNASEAELTHFEVWDCQVNPQEVSAGDPVDLSKHLDGNPTVRPG